MNNIDDIADIYERDNINIQALIVLILLDNAAETELFVAINELTIFFLSICFSLFIRSFISRILYLIYSFILQS